MSKLIIRLSLILFWVVLIFGVLYLPKWKVLNLNANAINIFVWGDILEPSVIQAFERETGIKVRLNYYSSNEELIVKLKATRGVGYDLIIPSDYAIPTLVQEDLLKQIDQTQFHHWEKLNPRLLGHPFDPQNRYSIPFEWEVFGFGIDKNQFKRSSFDASWKLVFDPAAIDYKITMINDPIEAILFGAFYLFGDVEHLTSDQLLQVKHLLIEQKKWIEAYTDFRGDYFLATKNCPLVVASSSYIFRAMRKFPFIDFVMPKEGSFITIESLCIPKASKKEKLVYRLINFLFRPESIVAHYEAFGFFPSSLHALDKLELNLDMQNLLLDSKENFNRLHFTHLLATEQQLRDL
ncbi:MAG: ABC transporter substrate-binding protein, partial [Anaerolineae bacterium]